MLSDEERESAYYGGVKVCAETTDDDGSGWDAAGLRAVEAAVRADMQPREVRTVDETPVERVAHFWSEWTDDMAPLHERGAYRMAAEDFAKKFIVTDRTPSTPNQQGDN